MKQKSKNLVQPISLPFIKDDKGFLVFAETEKHISFPVKRVFYIGGVPKGDGRGFHAHRQNVIALFCISGTITIRLDNGFEKADVFLNEPNKGLLIDRKVWHSMENFQKDTILLVFASIHYDESDYIRKYDEFTEIAHK